MIIFDVCSLLIQSSVRQQATDGTERVQLLGRGPVRLS
uniref:Uncharacterized protein n=1 Tax=Arundo donax TaxID=35708 RepID=A0A0A9HUU4_ARUDO